MNQTIHYHINKILSCIHEPLFPSYSVSIEDYGACAGTDSCQTIAIQHAINSVFEHGGGTVLVPSGRYLTGSLELKSNVRLHLAQADSILCFTTEMTEEHYPIDYCHWEATPCYNYRALVYAHNAHNIALTGPGTLDAQASMDNWWGWHHQIENAWSEDRPDLQNPARMKLREMNLSGIPIEERRFGNGHYLRPNFIQFIHCSQILLDGFTLKNSPMWQLNPVICDQVIVRNVTLSAHGANSDGCDPESCTNVLIEHCSFDTGDDCISLKSGRDRDGRLAALACKNIVIRDNLFLDGHGGIALGSEMSGGIEHVYATDNRFESPNLTYILRFKTNAKRGGFIRNIWMNNTYASTVGAASVHATMLYEDGHNGNTLPTFEDIHIENLKAHGGDYGLFLEAFPEVPIKGLTMNNVEIDGVQTPIRAMNWENPVLEHVFINNMSYPRPTDVQMLGIPSAGTLLTGKAQYLGGNTSDLLYEWSINGSIVHSGQEYMLTESDITNHSTAHSSYDEISLRAYTANSAYACSSQSYRIMNNSTLELVNALTTDQQFKTAYLRLLCQKLLPYHTGQTVYAPAPNNYITRLEMAHILIHFCKTTASAKKNTDFIDINSITSTSDRKIIDTVIANELIAPIKTAEGAYFKPHHSISRQEMATITMQACGVSYKNASTTRPVCTDTADINAVFATNASRSLYYGFMTCDNNNQFHPNEYVTWHDAVIIMSRVADFAGM